ncbi:MAG: N-acetylmuramoyl-L-alanine amidase [Lachnospiraceae bacterium]|nr:N-acetylmuramoyl-L-alanine amidase [Lachnospiraceae bacterium]
MGIKINVDAGHGSNTAGKRTRDGYREHWINVMTAGFLAASLRRCGFTVMTTGFDDDDATDDPDTSIVSRQKAVKAGKCDVSVSCHANADGKGGWTSAEGVITYIHSDAVKAKNSLALARVVQQELVKGTSQRDRGIGKSNLGMCNASYMGCDYAILAEIGFMTNRVEAEMLKTDKFCKEQAEDICRGICKFYNVPYAGSLQSDQGQDHVLSPGLYRVTIDNLYIRKGPGTNYDRVKKITPGVYTITEVRAGTGSTAGWGHLKSEAGWISLDYAEFIR